MFMGIGANVYGFSILRWVGGLRGKGGGGVGGGQGEGGGVGAWHGFVLMNVV